MTVFFAPLDLSDENVANALTLIATAIPERERILEVMQRAELDVGGVDISGASFDVWTRVVRLASDNFRDHILLDAVFRSVPRLESQLAEYDPVAGIFHIATDDPDADLEELRALVAVLSEHVHDIAMIERVVLQTPGLDFNFADTNPRLLWTAVVRKAAQSGVLPLLYQRASMGRNVIRQRFMEHLRAAAQPSPTGATASNPSGDSSWYPDVDRSTTRFFGRRRHIPAIDREDIRTGLEDLRRGDLSCLLVGGTHPGANHTREFIRYYSNRNPGMRDDFQRFVIRPNTHVVPNAESIMSDIAGAVDFKVDAAAASDEQPAATAKRLANCMVRGLRSATGSGWIVIYIADPNELKESALELIDQLALQFGDGNMDDRFALIVIGLNEPPDLGLDPVGMAMLGPIEAWHVRNFYSEVADHVGRALADVELDDLVRDAEAYLADVSALKHHVAQRCAGLFGGS